MNLAHAMKFCSFKIYFNIILSSILRLKLGVFFEVFRSKFCMLLISLFMLHVLPISSFLIW